MAKVKSYTAQNVIDARNRLVREVPGVTLVISDYGFGLRALAEDFSFGIVVFDPYAVPPYRADLDEVIEYLKNGDVRA